MKKRLKTEGQWSEGEIEEVTGEEGGNAARLEEELDAMGYVGRLTGERYLKLWKDEQVELQMRLKEEEEDKEEERKRRIKLLLPKERPSEVLVDRMNWEMRERER